MKKLSLFLSILCLQVAAQADSTKLSDAIVVMQCLQNQAQRLEIAAHTFEDAADQAIQKKETIENNILANRWGIQNIYGSIKSTVLRDGNSPQNPDSARTYAGQIANYEKRAEALRSIGDQVLALSNNSVLAQNILENYLNMLIKEPQPHTQGMMNDIDLNVQDLQQKLSSKQPLTQSMAQYNYKVTLPDCASLVLKFRTKYRE